MNKWWSTVLTQLMVISVCLQLKWSIAKNMKAMRHTEHGIFWGREPKRNSTASVGLLIWGPEFGLLWQWGVPCDIKADLVTVSVWTAGLGYALWPEEFPHSPKRGAAHGHGEPPPCQRAPPIGQKACQDGPEGRVHLKYHPQVWGVIPSIPDIAKSKP